MAEPCLLQLPDSWLCFEIHYHIGLYVCCLFLTLSCGFYKDRSLALFILYILSACTKTLVWWMGRFEWCLRQQERPGRITHWGEMFLWVYSPSSLGELSTDQTGYLEDEQERGELIPKKQATTNLCRVLNAKTFSLSNSTKTTCLQAFERGELALYVEPQDRIIYTFRAFNRWSGWNLHSAQFPGLG